MMIQAAWPKAVIESNTFFILYVKAEAASSRIKIGLLRSSSASNSEPVLPKAPYPLLRQPP